MAELSTKKCKHCGKTKPINNYIKSPFTKDGYEFYCKTCRKIFLTSYNDFVGYLTEHDSAINKKIWNDALKFARKKHIGKNDPKNLPESIEQDILSTAIRKYFSLANLPNMPKSKLITGDIKFEEEEEPIAEDVPEDISRRWGKNLTEEAYEYMESIYQDLISNYESDTPIQRLLYESTAKTFWEAEMARRKGDIVAYEKCMKVASSLLNDAKLKPVQKTIADSGGLATWGEWIKLIEETEPIPEPRDEFKDVDGIRKYIDKYFVGHFSKILGLESDFRPKDGDIIEGDLNGGIQ
jgi:hypothetical protein